MRPRRHALVVGSAPVSGAGQHYARLIRGADLLIAADAGLEVCLAVDRIPDVCVGDFDSVDPAALDHAAAAGARIRRHPPDKDMSDLDLGVAVAREAEVAGLSITAAYTRRIDHTLAALGTLAGAADLGATAEEPAWYGIALHERTRSTLDLTLPMGTVFSLMAVLGPATASVEGVRYPLSGHPLPGLSSHGLSNVATALRQRVRVQKGALLVLVNRPGIDAASIVRPPLCR
ncbi:MAG: thiamine diphosphokinase [Coriobacteriia bacterium]